jgi:Uma2 family endonuclease
MTQPAEKRPAWEEVGLPAPGTRLTAAEWDALPESMTRIDLIDGVVVYPHLDTETLRLTPTPDHQSWLGDVAFELMNWVKGLGGEVFIAPLEVYLDEANRVQPDVMWLASESNCTREETRLNGAPELVIEILSPDTVKHDKSAKFKLYEQHGVLEYWIVDPLNRFIELWRRQASRLAQQGIFQSSDSFTSAALSDQIVDVAAIFIV